VKEIFAPLGQSRRDLVLIFFGDEGVKAGLRLEQRGVERPFLAIARVKMEFALGGGRSKRWEERRRAESEAAEGRRKRGDGSSLAATEEEVASVRINQIRLDLMRLTRMTRLPCPS
jgi:hypothetical protein